VTFQPSSFSASRGSAAVSDRRPLLPAAITTMLGALSFAQAARAIREDILRAGCPPLQIDGLRPKYPGNANETILGNPRNHPETERAYFS